MHELGTKYWFNRTEGTDCKSAPAERHIYGYRLNLRQKGKKGKIGIAVWGLAFLFFSVQLSAQQNDTMYLQKGNRTMKYATAEIDSITTLMGKIWAFDSLKIFRNNTENELHNVNDITAITFSELDIDNVPRKTFYVATNGTDAAQGGTETNPWKTINYAIRNVPKDALCTIIVKDGIYNGTTLQGNSYHFEYPCMIKAETPYKAKFKGNNRVFSIYDASNITFSGLEIYGEGVDTVPVKGNEYIIHISNNSTRNITFENCIIHDCYNNDMVKINVRPKNITFSNCVFYNQCPRGGDQFFDIIGASNVVIEKSIFFNHYESSERGGTFPSNKNIPANEFLTRSQGFILVKNMSERNRGVDVSIRKNIFFNWTGKPDACFIILGEGVSSEETSFVHYQAENIEIENNLFLYNPYNGTDTVGKRGMLLAQSVRNLKVRANTVLGTRPGMLYSTRGFMLYTHRSAIDKGELPASGWEFTNNIFCDNQSWTGDNRPILSFVSSSSPPFEDDGTGKAVAGSYLLLNNLYWAGGVNGDWVCRGGGDNTKLIVAEDKQRIENNPLLPADFSGGITVPVLTPQNSFISGNASIREEFVRLVLEYAVPQFGGAGIGKADYNYMPKDDILDNTRSKSPSVGCCERP